MMMLYKYRPFTSFRFLVDIMLYGRLYAAPYTALNDPMEGFYLLSSNGILDEQRKRTLLGEKKRLGICSLSKWSDHPLLWAHYANGHNGVVLGLEVCEQDYDVREMRYVDRPPKISLHNYGPETAKHILSTKLSAWSYEDEVRVFVEDNCFVKIRLKEVSRGARLPQEDWQVLLDIRRAFCPEVKMIVGMTGYA